MDIICEVCGRALPEGTPCCPHCGSAANTASRVQAAVAAEADCRKKGTPGGFCRIFFSALLCLIFIGTSFSAIFSAAMGRSFLDGSVSRFIDEAGYFEQFHQMGRDGWISDEELTDFVYEMVKYSVPEAEREQLYRGLAFMMRGHGAAFTANESALTPELKQTVMDIFSMGRVPAVKTLGIAQIVISVLVAVCLFVLNFRRPRNAFMYVGLPLLLNAVVLGPVGLWPARTMSILSSGGVIGVFTDVIGRFAITCRWICLGCFVVGIVFVLLYALSGAKRKAARAAGKAK